MTIYWSPQTHLNEVFLEIVAANHEFLERVAHALATNDYLFGRDNKAIQDQCAIVNVTL